MFFVIFWIVLVRYTWLSNSSRFFFPTISTFGCFWSQWPTSLAVTSGCPTMRCGRLPSRSDVNKIQTTQLQSTRRPTMGLRVCSKLQDPSAATSLLSRVIFALVILAVAVERKQKGSIRPARDSCENMSVPEPLFQRNLQIPSNTSKSFTRRNCFETWKTPGYLKGSKWGWINLLMDQPPVCKAKGSTYGCLPFLGFSQL